MRKRRSLNNPFTYIHVLETFGTNTVQKNQEKAKQNYDGSKQKKKKKLSNNIEKVA